MEKDNVGVDSVLEKVTLAYYFKAGRSPKPSGKWGQITECD